MFNKPVKTTQVTWETVQSNAAILFFAMAVPEKIDSPLILLCQGVMLFSTGMIPLGIKRIPISASIACGIVMAFGCWVGCLSLAPWFPALRSVVESKWGEAVPSVSISLSVVLWIFVVLKISPATRALRIGHCFRRCSSELYPRLWYPSYRRRSHLRCNPFLCGVGRGHRISFERLRDDCLGAPRYSGTYRPWPE